MTSAEEVAELAGRMGEYLPETLPFPVAVHDGLGPADLRVFDAVPVRGSVDLPSLSSAAGLDPETVRAALGRLELRGLVARDGTGWRQIRARKA